jgi:hypothetical protein
MQSTQIQHNNTKKRLDTILIAVTQGGPQQGIGTMVTIVDAAGGSFKIEAAWATSLEVC